MSEFHEACEALPAEVRDLHRALASLKEEIEAIDWYTQRVAACSDQELLGLLAHNRDEEIEHACMALEWLRKNMPPWDQVLKKYLFQEGSVLAVEEEAKSKELPAGSRSDPASLGIGSLRS
jgi:ferritin-like protein